MAKSFFEAHNKYFQFSGNTTLLMLPILNPDGVLTRVCSENKNIKLKMGVALKS